MKSYSDFIMVPPISDATNRRLLHGYAAATSYADACNRVDNSRSERFERDTIVMSGETMDELRHSSWCKHHFECDTGFLSSSEIRMEVKRHQLASRIDPLPDPLRILVYPLNRCQGRSFVDLLKD